jgi:hypothetical protein
MQVQYKFNTLLRFAVCAVMACSLIPLVGCTPPDSTAVSSSTSVNTQTGATTVTVGVTVTWKHQKLQQFALWMGSLSGTDLASLDPSQAILNYSLSNATISSTSGPVTVTLTDDNTGVIVGQQTFQYVVNGNGLFAQDPNAVSAWLDQFTSYSSLDVNLTTATDMQATSSGTATVTSNALYQGVTYTSSSASWAGSPIGGGGCKPPRCPLQE